VVKFTGKVKTKRCKHCKEPFVVNPKFPLQFVCSWGCGLALSKINKSKKAAKESKEATKVMKEGLLTHKDYLKMAQIVFNIYIRFRDKDQKCISCDCSMAGRKGDASHYYASGSNPALRFDPDNVHLSCVPCNQFKHGNLIEYGIRLPIRIGVDRFEALAEKRNEPLKITIPELKELIKIYKQKLKQ